MKVLRIEKISEEGIFQDEINLKILAWNVGMAEQR